jgi:hypothetical protein
MTFFPHRRDCAISFPKYSHSPGYYRIADAHDTTVDFLVNGNTEDEANAALQDAEVIRYFKEVDALLQEDKNALLRVIAGFIRDVKTKQTYAS